MYISKKTRQKVFEKYAGMCAYSGTKLEHDWQIDHIKPVRRNNDGTAIDGHNHNIDNMMPVQNLINHYKHGLSLEEYRDWYLGTMHEKLAKLPQKARTEKSIKRIKYMIKIASYFGITVSKPFSGQFYFEKL